MTRNTRRERFLGSIVLALLGGLLCLALPVVGPTPAAGTALAAAAPTSTLPPSSLTVGGSADVNVAPDMATVSFGALAIRPNAQAALTAVNTVIAAAVRSLHALRIPDRRIQTSNLSLDPHYDNSGALTGYNASETLSVIATNLAQVGRIVDAGVGAGANTNVSIAFGLKDETAARLEALRQAIASARARADTAAAALGQSLKGAHVQLSESGQPIPRPVVSVGVMAAARSADSGATKAFGGTLTVHEDVTLTYTF